MLLQVACWEKCICITKKRELLFDLHESALGLTKDVRVSFYRHPAFRDSFH